MLRLFSLVAVLLAATAAVACDDGSVGDLQGLPGGGQGAGPGGGMGGGGGGGGFTNHGGDGGTSSEEAKAETAFRALLDDFTKACGGACHTDGKGNAPAYLAMPDPYKSIKAFRGIVVKDVSTSSALTKGRHEGPDLVDPLRNKVVAWLTLEAAALASQQLPATDAFTVTAGANTVDISKGGKGVTGAKLTFNATISGKILTLSNMQLVAPASTGVHIVYPVFDLVPPMGEPIRDTSFSNADQTVAAGQTATLHPGILILTDYDPTFKMKIEFTKLEAAVGGGTDGGTTGGGCKSVTSFVTNAVPAVQQNGCLNCHNTGGSGNASLDLSGLGANPPDNARACAQMLSKADPNDPAQSDIIVAPTGGVQAHPFKNASQNYVQMIEAWLANEK